MALAGNDRAILTARVGAARVGAVRLGFVPKHTKASPNGAFYIWRNKVGMETQKISISWTAKVR